MRRLRTILSLAILAAGLALRASAQDVCAICGKPIVGPIYLMTDKVTGEQVMVCSNCVKLPKCFICGLPVKDGGITLPDGRVLCARDARTAVLNDDDAQRICAGVEDDLDRLFSRFTSFPTNVDVSIIDRVDVDATFDTAGHTFESPDVLGWEYSKTNGGRILYKIGLLSGMPAADLRATCAHELSHTWVAANVPPERHARLNRDAEEGFCEMMAYLLMDSQNEAAQEKAILINHYTRGQVQLFLEAERRYGFEQILDWMQYGETARLVSGRLEETGDIKIPAPVSGGNGPAPVTRRPAAVTNQLAAATNGSITLPLPAVPKALPAPATINLQGILWGNTPMAIINGRSFYVNDEFSVKLGATHVVLRCLAIQQTSVRVQEVDSGREEVLYLRNK